MKSLFNIAMVSTVRKLQTFSDLKICQISFPFLRSFLDSLNSSLTTYDENFFRVVKKSCSQGMLKPLPLNSLFLSQVEIYHGLTFVTHRGGLISRDITSDFVLLRNEYRPSNHFPVFSCSSRSAKKSRWQVALLFFTFFLSFLLLCFSISSSSSSWDSFF